MSAPRERTRARAAARTCACSRRARASRSASSRRFGGVGAWTPFLDRLAERRRVVVPSLPGFPGAGGGFRSLDDLPDWLAATLDLLEAAGLGRRRSRRPRRRRPARRRGRGALARERRGASCSSRRSVSSTSGEPVADVWARRASEVPGALLRAARRLREDPRLSRRARTRWSGRWPRCARWRPRRACSGRSGDRGLAKRLHRITAPTLLLWGSDDRIVPASYAKRFAAGIAGKTEIRTIPDAGHRLDLDAPDATAAAILAWPR